MIGCGRRSRTFIFGFKARRVASYTIPQNGLVAAAGIEPASLDYQPSALPLGYTAIEVWLWRKDSNLRMAALTVRCLTSLATPQEIWWLWVESNHQPGAY